MYLGRLERGKLNSSLRPDKGVNCTREKKLHLEDQLTPIHDDRRKMLVK